MFIVFDLDGTLIDGYAGITDALGFAMESLGIAPLPEEQVRGMVGEGLERLLEKAVGAEKVPRGVALFRERYALVFHEKTALLPDVPAVLARLAADGHAMAVASNKPAHFSRRILESKGVAERFRAIAGPDAETPPKPDPTMLLRLMEEADAAPDETVVVGDMEIDAQMASAAGCRAVLIPGGSRSAAELALVDADAHLDRLAELPDWIARAVDASRKASSSTGAERAG
jgi:phosphoglycolate phosphatase